MKKVNRIPVRVILLSLLAYVACFFFMDMFSGRGLGMGAVIPVIAIGWHLGLGWGVCAGLLSLPVNIMMASFLELDWWDQMVIDGLLIPSTAGFVFIGGVVGRISSLSKELKQHRDHLNQLVQDRTVELTLSNEQLKARDQELGAANMQLKSSEQQLRSAMEQLEASNQQLIAGQREIEESKEYLESIFKTTKDGIIVSDEQGSFVKVNSAVEEMTGYSEGELAGRHPLDLVVMDELQSKASHEISESFEKGEIKNLEVSWRRKDGSICPVEFNTKFLKDDKGNISSSVSAIRDITERKQVLEALKESEERLELSYKATNDGLWDWNIKDDKCFFSPRYSTMLGYEPNELLASFETWKSLIHPDDLELANQKVEDHLEKRSDAYVQEYRMQTKAGEFFWVQSRGRVIEFGEKGEPVRMIGIHTDISERKADQEEKKILEARLQQAQKMEEIGTLAGGVAHDFNNLLGVIMGYTEMSLDDAPEGTGFREGLNEVLTAANRAKDLVDQILTFSRQTDQELKPVRVKPIIEELLKFIRASFPATIEIKQELKAESDVVMSDPTQIHQVLMNLCTNAKHAMEEKGGVLEISLTEETPGPESGVASPERILGKYLKLSVSDTGSGMDPAIAKRIFDPFFTTKEQGKGSGLGLSVVHGIVKSSGGEIDVLSEQGKGTTFLVFLPLVESRSPASEAVSLEHFSGGNEHILLVDDEEVICNMTQKILEKLGYRVISRTSSIEALDVFSRMPEKFDLVITDQTMPDLTGADLSKELLLIRPGIPIILCTGFSEVINKSQAFQMGISEYVTKPVVTAKLAGVIRKTLNEKKEN